MRLMSNLRSCPNGVVLASPSLTPGTASRVLTRVFGAKLHPVGELRMAKVRKSISPPTAAIRAAGGALNALQLAVQPVRSCRSSVRSCLVANYRCICRVTNNFCFFCNLLPVARKKTFTCFWYTSMVRLPPNSSSWLSGRLVEPRIRVLVGPLLFCV